MVAVVSERLIEAEGHFESLVSEQVRARLAAVGTRVSPPSHLRDCAVYGPESSDSIYWACALRHPMLCTL